VKKVIWLPALLLALFSFTVGAEAQSPPVPKNIVRGSDGKLYPAPGFNWLTDNPKDLRVRWLPGMRHNSYPNVLAAINEGTWRPAPGFKFATNVPGDLRVVRSGPSDEEVARGALKAFGALALHKASIPQRGDTFGQSLAREVSRAARDELLDSAFQDLFPGAKVAERAAVRNLAILALDGRLAYDRDRVLNQLRATNPDMADAVQAAEFLIRLGQAVEKSKR